MCPPYSDYGCCLNGDAQPCCECVSPGICETFVVGSAKPGPATTALDACVCKPEVCGDTSCKEPCALDGIPGSSCRDCVLSAASGACASVYAACPDAVKTGCMDTCADGIHIGAPVCGAAPASASNAYQEYVACAQQSCATDCVLVVKYHAWADNACKTCMSANCAAAAMACAQN